MPGWCRCICLKIRSAMVGMATLSWPDGGLIHHVHRLKLPGLEPRGAVIVDLELKGASLRIIAAHFGLLRRSRSQQAHAILSAADIVNRPTIMLGDLNEWRVNKRSSLLNLLPHFGPIDAVVPSFPARFPLLRARPHHGPAGEPHYRYRGASVDIGARRLRPPAAQGTALPGRRAAASGDRRPGRGFLTKK